MSRTTLAQVEGIATVLAKLTGLPVELSVWGERPTCYQLHSDGRLLMGAESAREAWDAIHAMIEIVQATRRVAE